MARGPFQGTWQAGVRPTVVTAPDAIVYINGQPDMIACGSCRRRFDITRYITNIQVDLSVDNAPGSASISLSIPRHTIDDFFFEGEPILVPMMEVEIYAKGYFLVEGLPQYYPIFWGMITEVSDNYSGGEHTFSVNCADILKWWEYCKMNVNSAFTQPAGQLGKDYITGNVFHGANVYDVIWTLAQQAFGDVILATGSLTSLIKESVQKDTFRRALGDLMGYWNQRFGQMRSNLMLYGVTGAAVRGDILYEAQPTGNSKGVNQYASKAVRKANGGQDSSQLLFDPEVVQPFRSNISNAGNPNLWQSEYQTKLEIANACKEAVGFEFYMDVTGDIVFKPPFYNLDVLSNKPVSWIQDIDIIDWNFSLSEAEVVTHLQMQGSFEGGAMDMGITSDFNTPYTQVIDYHLLRQYGWRTQSYNAEYLASTFDMFYAGVDILDRMNARRHRATVNIPLRPELRLGFPVYVASKDQVWYLQGISHNIQMGGRAQTTLTLTAKRKKFIAPKGIGQMSLTGFKRQDAKVIPLQSSVQPTTKQLSKTGAFSIKVGEAAEIPPKVLSNESLDDPYAPLILRHPKTGRVVGYPNVAMAYTRPYQPSDKDLKKALGQDVTDKRKGEKVRAQEGGTAKTQNLDRTRQGTTQTRERDLADKHANNRFFYGLTSAGVYSYVHDASKVIQELLLIPATNITVNNNSSAAERFGKTAIIRPVSDERGFEVIGHFRYGRGVSLRDGSLVLAQEGEVNERATVSTQLALSGDLLASLQAQSAGLSSVTSSYLNPADTIARLIPEDLQTAGTLNPETGKAEFTALETNFIDVAPLNSPQNRGAPVNVEASQLSNALTLAEMTIKDDTSTGSTGECSCLLGRSDLAFISVGYQIHSLGAVAADESNLATSSTGTGSFGAGVDPTTQTSGPLADAQADLEAAQANLAAVTAEVQADPLFLEGTTGDPIVVAGQRRIAEAQAQVTAAQATVTAMQGSVSQNLGTSAITNDGDLETHPVAARSVAPSREDTLRKVEGFLVNLYSALDTPHQEYEKALRGGSLPMRSREEALNPGVPPDPGDFAPPFNPINRARGGDPEALALQGTTAQDQLSGAWKRFGDQMKAAPERARLQNDIDRLSGQLRDLDKEQEALMDAHTSGSTIIPVDINERLKEISRERAKAQQELDNARTKLRTLNNEFAP